MYYKKVEQNATPQNANECYTWSRFKTHFKQQL